MMMLSMHNIDKSLPEDSVFRELLPDMDEVVDPESRELWGGDGHRRYKRSRSRNKSSSSRSSRNGRRSRSRSRNRDTTLIIVKDDNSRSTSNCVDDLDYWFDGDFDDVDITRSDRNARSGDIVVIVDGDVDCDDLRLVTLFFWRLTPSPWFRSSCLFAFFI